MDDRKRKRGPALAPLARIGLELRLESSSDSEAHHAQAQGASGAELAAIIADSAERLEEVTGALRHVAEILLARTWGARGPEGWLADAQHFVEQAASVAGDLDMVRAAISGRRPVDLELASPLATLDRRLYILKSVVRSFGSNLDSSSIDRLDEAHMHLHAKLGIESDGPARREHRRGDAASRG